MARRHFRKHVVVLPEAATIIFGGGFPRETSHGARRAAQRAIFHVESELEAMAVEEGNASVVLCDRGTVDGAAYWPDAPDTFWSALGTTREREFARYATVIHLHPPSATGGYDHTNAMRRESAEEAASIDERIEAAWAGHPRRLFVDHETDFLVKAAHALALVETEVAVAQAWSVPVVRGGAEAAERAQGGAPRGSSDA
jgi:hypothetical protein